MILTIFLQIRLGSESRDRFLINNKTNLNNTQRKGRHAQQHFYHQNVVHINDNID